MDIQAGSPKKNKWMRRTPSRQELIQAADAVMETVHRNNWVLLREWVALPHIPDCQPEVTRMTMQFGDRIKIIEETLQKTHEQLDVSPNMLNLVVLDRVTRRMHQ